MQKLPAQLGLLADIHGNLTALQAVLDDLDRKGIRDILVAGDHVGDCPQPNEVLALLASRQVWAVLGNRDADVLAYFRGELPGWDAYAQMASMRWTARVLNEFSRSYLAGLPGQIAFDGETAPGGIRLVHGSPFQINELLYRDSHPERVGRALDGISERILICGHTHQPWHRWLDGKLIVNPGAVGVHFNPAKAAEYAILTLDENNCAVEHCTAAYDLDILLARFASSGLDEAGGIWTSTIKQSLVTGHNVSLEFIHHALSVARSSGASGQAVLGGRSFISDEAWRQASEEWKKVY